MQYLTKISIAVVCALGVTVVVAQTVQPRVQGATQARPPLQTAQAPAAGGAATGASTATAAGAASVGGATAGTVAFVSLGVAAVAGAASDSGGSTVTHTP
jgi:hypothetical protein